jgi:hypothetical protein
MVKAEPLFEKLRLALPLLRGRQRRRLPGRRPADRPDHEHGQAYEDVAEVLVLAGKTAEAAQALEEAVAIYEPKGAVALTERVRARLAELGTTRLLRDR